MLSTAAAKVLILLRQPGRKPDIRGTASANVAVPVPGAPDEEKGLAGFAEPIKHSRLDRWLDGVVAFSGSTFAFFAILAAVAAWCLMGIKYGSNENWQVIISDVQALLCYVYDSLLVRQQLNQYDDNMAAIAQLQSRSASHLRMLRMLKHDSLEAEKTAASIQSAPAYHVEDELPKETRFGRFITVTAMISGHVVTLTLFWVAVIAWLAIGHLFQYSDLWQLYMNSATSGLMILTFILLANVGQRHAVHQKRSLDQLFTADSGLESCLRALTHDTQPNPEVVLSAPQVNKAQRAIFYYADFVGTLVGIAILTTVICVWVAVGPAMHYSSNWWLLIGTYAGLIGMFDGFVLRNMQARLRAYGDDKLKAVHNQDLQMLGIADLADPSAQLEKPCLTTRISQVIDRVTSHEAAVGLSLLTLVGLLAGSTAMHWSLTGQLLSNVPPSIIESWLMLTLITGHNLIEERKRNELQLLYNRRVRLLSSLAPRESGICAGRP